MCLKGRPNTQRGSYQSSCQHRRFHNMWFHLQKPHNHPGRQYIRLHQTRHSCQQGMLRTQDHQWMAHCQENKRSTNLNQAHSACQQSSCHTMNRLQHCMCYARRRGIQCRLRSSSFQRHKSCRRQFAHLTQRSRLHKECTQQPRTRHSYLQDRPHTAVHWKTVPLQESRLHMSLIQVYSVCQRRMENKPSRHLGYTCLKGTQCKLCERR
jgi:hypothetical protein